MRIVVRSIATLAVVAASVIVTATQAGVPARIVSTSPSITETLFALGLGDHVVGVSNYCRFPAEVAKLPKVGSFLKPDPELIARLKPDLVFVYAGPNSTGTQLATLDIRTADVETGSLPQVFSTIRGIGAAANVPGRAEQLVARINARLDRVKAAGAGRPPRKVLIIVGRRTGTLTDIVAVGRGSYLSDIATIAGGVNVLDAATKYPRISMESVIRLAPDVLIDVGEMGESPDDSDRRRATTERLWAREKLVKAVRDGGVHVSTDEAWVVPGPRMIDIAELMAEWFHGIRLR